MLTHDLSALLRTATDRLARAGIGDPRVDTELLFAHVLRLSRGELLAAAARGETVDRADVQAIEEVIARRAAREPLQHITGIAPFRHLELRVGPGVFVPRPETEVLAQLAIDALSAIAAPEPIAVDLGTGSGALALSMATEVPRARVYAVEGSVDAYIWADENVRASGAGNIALVFGDFAHALGELEGTVAVVASNPPYVPAGALPRDPEVRFHDPESALYGGADGLDPIRVLSGVGLRLTHSGGSLMVEHGEWQGEAVRQILTSDGWLAARTHPDLTRRDRVTTALRPPRG